jgi:hypothetical protein
MTCRGKCLLAAVTMLVVLLTVAAIVVQTLGRRQLSSEPEAERPNLHILGIAPVKVSPEREFEILRDARRILAAYHEVAFIYSTARLREHDGTMAEGYHLFVELRSNDDWPALALENGKQRRRTKAEFIEAVKGDLEAKLPGILWIFEPAGQVTVLDAPLPQVDIKDAAGREPTPLEKLKALQDQILERD